MKRLMRLLLTIVILMLFVSTALLVYAGPDKSMKDLPSGVRATFEKYMRNGDIIEIETKRQDGVTLYELDFDLEGKEYSVQCSPSGDVIEFEKQIKFEELPEAIRSKLKREFPDGDYEEINFVTSYYYEIDVEANGKQFEFIALPYGKIRANTEEHDDKEEDDVDDD